MQRLTKYQLLLKDLSDTFLTTASGQFELEESVEAMLEVIRAVNDSLHQVGSHSNSRSLFCINS